MNRQAAAALIEEHIRAIYGFALKRCHTPEDAEDLSQEIVLRAYRALLLRDNIREPVKFLWTVAHNTLTNYYRQGAKNTVGVPLDEVADVLPDPDSWEPDNRPDAETLRRLRSEVAHLSETRRRIVIAYYFENRKQADIAASLGVPLGTVKWHLFEAKRDLRKGMEHMRQNTDLTFNPITFTTIGINGSSGTGSAEHIFRSTLTQNIAYCVRREAMTVNEIADTLGVSPVYVEGEVKFLEEYGLLRREAVTPRGEAAYIADFLITEPTAELLTMQDCMYKKAAALVATDLCERLIVSGILDDPTILCGQNDRNFLLWSLVPFILAQSGEHLRDNRISFDEVATIRPDGGHNIFHADVVDEHMKLPQDYVYLGNWCGPAWIDNSRLVHWQIDHDWSDRDRGEDRLQSIVRDSQRMLSLYERTADPTANPTTHLSRDEYAWLSEQGYLAPGIESSPSGKTPWQVVILANQDIRQRLLRIGNAVKEAHAAELEALKAPYVAASLAAVPPHMRQVKAFELQHVFHSDGWFLLHCIKALLASGYLIPPTEAQRKTVTMVICPEEPTDR